MKVQESRLRAWCVMAGCAALLCACGGGSSKMPAHVVGTLSGVLADDAQAAFEPGPPDAPVPWIIGQGSLSDADRASVINGFRSGVPIVLLDAGEREINALRQLLGIGGAYAPPESGTRLDAYAVDTDVIGALHEFTLAPPLRPTSTEIGYVAGGAEGTESLQPTLTPTASDWSDTDVMQSERMAALRDWLARDKSRDDAARAMVTDRAMAQMSGRNVIQETDIPNYPIDNFATPWERVMVMQHRSNIHTITWQSFAAYRREDGMNVFMVRLRTDYDSTREFFDSPPLDRGILYRNDPVYNDRGRSTYAYEVGGRVNEVAQRLKGGQLEPGTYVSNQWPQGLKTNLRADDRLNSFVKDISIDGQSRALFRWEVRTSYAVGNWPSCWVEMDGRAATKSYFWAQWVWMASNTARDRQPNGLPVMFEFRDWMQHMYRGGFFGCDITDWREDTQGRDSFYMPWPPKN